MATKVESPKVFVICNNRPIEVRLFQLKVDTKKNYCHRPAGELHKEKLEGLATNLVHEGQIDSIIVIETDQTITRNGETNKVYLVIAGHRRVLAMKQAAAANLDAARFNHDMLVRHADGTGRRSD